jgi:hypothetical protein
VRSEATRSKRRRRCRKGFPTCSRRPSPIGHRPSRLFRGSALSTYNFNNTILPCTWLLLCLRSPLVPHIFLAPSSPPSASSSSSSLIRLRSPSPSCHPRSARRSWSVPAAGAGRPAPVSVSCRFADGPRIHFLNNPPTFEPEFCRNYGIANAFLEETHAMYPESS